MFLKDPDSTLDYRVDWSAAASSAIVESRWTVAPVEAGGVGVAADGVAGMVATARLSGGVPGHLYRVANRVVLADGAADERSLVIRVEER